MGAVLHVSAGFQPLDDEGYVEASRSPVSIASVESLTAIDQIELPDAASPEPVRRPSLIEQVAQRFSGNGPDSSL